MELKKTKWWWPFMLTATYEAEIKKLQDDHEEKIQKLLNQFKEVVDLTVEGHLEVHQRNLALIIELSRVSGVALVEETLPSGFKILAKNAAEGIVETLHRKRSEQ